jgi:V8-like Glu-specific endopeptidase
MLAVCLLAAAALGPLALPASARLTPAGTAYPYTAVVKVQSTFPDRQGGIGSGVLIGRFHVLTCAHNVYSFEHGGYAARVVVTPMARDDHRPFGSALATRKRIYRQWPEADRRHPGKTGDDSFDIALLTLDRPLGDQAGWMPFGHAPDARLGRGRRVVLAGYPGQKYGARRMYVTTGPLVGLSESGRTFTYQSGAGITVIPGMSGGPVWAVDGGGQRVVIGVHVGGGNVGYAGRATRITERFFNDIQRWRRADAAPARSRASGLSLPWEEPAEGLDPSLTAAGAGPDG